MSYDNYNLTFNYLYTAATHEQNEAEKLEQIKSKLVDRQVLFIYVFL